MARFKLTENIFLNSGEVFDENMIDNPNLRFPQNTMWSENRPMKIEDVDIWEVIIEHGGPFGVYAAWQPYGELYIVLDKYSLVAEFSGINANLELEKYLQKEKIWYPKSHSTNLTL
jgi:hypothetical protein